MESLWNPYGAQIRGLLKVRVVTIREAEDKISLKKGILDAHIDGSTKIQKQQRNSEDEDLV